MWNEKKEWGELLWFDWWDINRKMLFDCWGLKKRDLENEEMNEDLKIDNSLYFISELQNYRKLSKNNNQ